MRHARRTISILLLAALASGATACSKDSATSQGGSQGGDSSPDAPTLAPVGEPAPTVDTLEGLEMKGTLSFVIEGSSVCAVVTESEKKRSLQLPGDWKFAQNPNRVQDTDGEDVLTEGQDVSSVSFSPAYPENEPTPCGGATEAFAVDGVTPATP